MIRRIFATLLLLALPVSAAAQVTPSPVSQAPLFGMPAQQGGSSNPFTNVVFTGQALGPVGNCTTAPAYSFTGDENTGYSSSGADALCLVTGGTSRVSVSSTAVTSTVPGLWPDAAGANAPSLAAKDDTDTGISFAGATMRYAMGGTYYMGMFATEFQLQSATSIGWSSGNIGSASDVSLSRGAANRLDLATGDSLYLVSGGLGVGSTPGSAGTITASSSISGSGNIITDGAAANMGPTGAGAKIYLANPLIFNTAPTVTSAGTSPSVTASNGTAAFRVNVGTGGTATTIVMAMPAATTGWNCHAENITAAAANRANQMMKQQSSTTTAVTVQNQTISTGAALAFTASDIVAFLCTAY